MKIRYLTIFVVVKFQISLLKNGTTDFFLCYLIKSPFSYTFRKNSFYVGSFKRYGSFLELKRKIPEKRKKIPSISIVICYF